MSVFVWCILAAPEGEHELAAITAQPETPPAATVADFLTAVLTEAGCRTSSPMTVQHFLRSGHQSVRDALWAPLPNSTPMFGQAIKTARWETPAPHETEQFLCRCFK